jgi:plastocyanin
VRSVRILPGIVGLVLVCVSCGGGGGDNNPSPAPSPTPPPPASSQASLTVSIAGEQGDQSFSPNPGTPGAARTVAWHNDDGVAHRIVANDGTFDTGNIGGGQTSAAITVPAGGINYHCSIHPSMIGAIGDPGGGEPPPCTGIYC